MIDPTDPLLSRITRISRLRYKPARHFATRAIDMMRAKWIFRGFNVGTRVSVQGPLYVDIQGRLEIGDRVGFYGDVLPTSLIVHPGAVLRVGAESLFNYGASIEAGSSVIIGQRCMFGSFVRISDSDGRERGPIVIGDDVWLAHGVIIGPGVTIGSGSVVAAGSVVTKGVPPQSMAVGNPARIMSLALRTPVLPAVEIKARKVPA